MSNDIERRRTAAEAMSGTHERRDFSATGLECRELGDGTLRMGGWASVTDTWYEVGDYEELIQPGSFRRTLSQAPQVNLLINHEGLPLASTATNTLRLSEDSRGLHWEADLDAEDPDSVSLARKVSKGLVRDCSFAFRVTDQSWSKDYKRRTIRGVELTRGDVSVCTVGANPLATVAMRSQSSAALENASMRDRERLVLLRAGWSPKPTACLPASLDTLNNRDRVRLARLKRAS